MFFLSVYTVSLARGKFEQSSIWYLHGVGFLKVDLLKTLNVVIILKQDYNNSNA